MARPDLPAGTVTFLFTDIEGSTRLLHELGDRYAEVLAEHRRRLREAFAAQGGVEVDTQGDAFFYAFTRASDALAAAAVGQAALDEGPVLVRMGVHTGEPTVTEEGYVGADVHLAARLTGAGHGGQVLVSEATARLVEAELRDLGEHRLKDIERPVRLLQLGEGRFPPLKTLNNSNLPLPATPLLGRKKELADVLRLLRVERTRLVTVTGPGGVGKTRFALEVAHELVEEFAHGVWFVDLSALRDPALVAPTIAATLGAKAELADHVADKELLVVLDNFEQVVEAAADMAELLRRCRNVQLFVTSREPLHVAGERGYPLRPLAESPAVELFRGRAEAADPHFDAPWQTLTAIAERLDRLPLAIELAAVRVKALGGDDLLARLDQRLPLLTSRARDVPARHRTLRATLEWSYELLAEDEQRLFARLAIFAGGCSFEAAQRVCDADLDTLQSLAEKSLTRVDDGRYSLFETVREYASSLATDGERAEFARRHAAYYLGLGEEHERATPVGRRSEAFRALSVDRQNFRAAVDWAVRAGEGDIALRLATVAGWYTVPASEWDRLFRRALPLASGAPSDRRIAALLRATYAAKAVRALDRAERLYEELLTESQSSGDVAAQAHALGGIGDIATIRGDFEHARELYRDKLDILERLGYEHERKHLLQALGEVEMRAGDLSAAEPLLEAALDAARRDRDPQLVAKVSHSLGDLALRAKRFGVAERRYLDGAGLADELGARELVAYCAAGLAAAAALRGDVALAGSRWGLVERSEGDGVVVDEGDRRFYLDLMGDVSQSVAFAGAAARTRASRLVGIE